MLDTISTKRELKSNSREVIMEAKTLLNDFLAKEDTDLVDISYQIDRLCNAADKCRQTLYNCSDY